MIDLTAANNPYRDDKLISACSIFGQMDTSGKPFSGDAIFRAMENMHERGNGLGGGFAVYGLYPDYPNHYAFHIMFASQSGRIETERVLREKFKIDHEDEVPTRPTEGITGAPLVMRYFALPLDTGTDADETVVQMVLRINSEVEDSFVFSSGRNMGVFKGVGYPEQIARFFKLEEYQGHIWTSHGRFPTNSQAWWGGAHPFSTLDWTVVHNGELSSYGANRAYLEDIGYKCTMFTDTEVLAYAIDLVMRRHKLPPEIFAKIVAPPLWEEIDRMPPPEKELHTALRHTYAGLLMNGPFGVVIAKGDLMMALTDRIRLRPLTAATKGTMVYYSSEEAAIRLVEPELDSVWTPVGGLPVIARIGKLPTAAQSGRRPARLRKEEILI